MYPPGGWGRAFRYIKHRVRRLPDSPERIARGIWAGVFTAFTPFYGIHFIIAALLARAMRGNIIAGLTGTFFGNPVTYVPIGVISLEGGRFLLGMGGFDDDRPIGKIFVEAWRDLRHNIWALFTSDTADWHGLLIFYQEVFFPYLIGGLIPGVICASLCYYLTVPVIRAYQVRRAGRIRDKFEEIKRNAAASADAAQKAK